MLEMAKSAWIITDRSAPFMRHANGGEESLLASLALVAVLASLMMGGAISLVVALRRRVLRRALFGAGLIAQSVISGSGMTAPVTTGVRFPFAVAVFAGSIISFWIRP